MGNLVIDEISLLRNSLFFVVVFFVGIPHLQENNLISHDKTVRNHNSCTLYTVSKATKNQIINVTILENENCCHIFCD